VRDFGAKSVSVGVGAKCMPKKGGEFPPKDRN
jgi:hypothetical protein